MKGRFLAMEPEDGATLRCGRFVITIKSTEASHIEFDRTASVKVNIKPSGE